MKVAFYDTHSYEKNAFLKANTSSGHEITFLDAQLGVETAIMASGHECVCAFVNDSLSKDVLTKLKAGGTRFIALRSAGFNHVDLIAAQELGMKVARVPEYSPYAVAEHAVALILNLNRKIHKAYNRIREGNFSLDGLVGFDLHGKTVGVIGTGKIGKAFIRIMKGFGCHVVAFDPKEDSSLGVTYLPFEEVLKRSDIVSLHLPLNKSTFHLIDANALKLLKQGAMFINTSRGGLVDTKALIQNLKSCHLGAAGLDVYEEEEHVFFRDHSFEILNDDVLARLMTFPNVILTSHQAFLTHEALGKIADTTLANISEFSLGKSLTNEVKVG